MAARHRHRAQHHRRVRAPRPLGARRLPHDRCRRRSALCRQGQEPQEAHPGLCTADRPCVAHRAHGGGDVGHRVRLHRDRDRSAAAGSQPDQAVAAALQRAAARRQVVSLYPHHRGRAAAPDLQAPRRAQPRRRLFRAVRRRQCGQPHHHRAGARVPDPLLLRHRVREPYPAMPAVPDQALLGALHRRDLQAGL